MNTALLLRMGKRSRSTTIENGVRLLTSSRSVLLHLHLNSIQCNAVHDPAFLCLRLAQVPVFGTRPEMFGTFGKHLMVMPHGASVVWNLAWNKSCCCCLGKSCYVLALPAGAVFPAEPARRSALPHMSRHVLVCLCATGTKTVSTVVSTVVSTSRDGTDKPPNDNCSKHQVRRSASGQYPKARC